MDHDPVLGVNVPQGKVEIKLRMDSSAISRAGQMPRDYLDEIDLLRGPSLDATYTARMTTWPSFGPEIIRLQKVEARMNSYQMKTFFGLASLDGLRETEDNRGSLQTIKALGLAELNLNGRWFLTLRGRAHMKQLLALPLPEPVYVDSEGKVIK